MYPVSAEGVVEHILNTLSLLLSLLYTVYHTPQERQPAAVQKLQRPPSSRGTR